MIIESIIIELIIIVALGIQAAIVATVIKAMLYELHAPSRQGKTPMLSDSLL